MGETPPGGRAHAAQVDGEGGEEEVKELEVEHVVVMSEVRKTWDALVHCLNHLHSRLFQIRAKVKELEVEHAVVMSEVSEIVEALEDMDL